MNVTRWQIIQRGLQCRCPNCGNRSLFPPKSLRIRERCPVCETLFYRGPGFFLGPLVINYTIAVFVFVLPAIVAGVRGAIPWVVALVLAGLGCVVIPALLYRYTWSWWLMGYFYLMPEFLPANGGPVGAAEED